MERDAEVTPLTNLGAQIGCSASLQVCLHCPLLIVEFGWVLLSFGIFGFLVRIPELQIRPNVEHSAECSNVRPNVHVLAEKKNFGFSGLFWGSD